MGESSMAIQVAPLPHVHQQGRGGPMYAIDSERRTRGPAPLQSGMLNGNARSGAPLSPASSTAGSPNSHNSRASEATHVGKDRGHYDTYYIAPSDLSGSNDTEQTVGAEVNGLKRSDAVSDLLNSDFASSSSSKDDDAEPRKGLQQAQSNGQIAGYSDRFGPLVGESAPVAAPQSQQLPAHESNFAPMEGARELHTANGALANGAPALGSQAPGLAINERGAEPGLGHEYIGAGHDHTGIGYELSGTHQVQSVAYPEARPETQLETQPQPEAQFEAQPDAKPEHLEAQHEHTESTDSPTTASGEIETDNTRTKPLRGNKSNQPSASRAAAAAAEMNDDVLVGTRVTEGHENFVTAYNMLTGIRVAVSRCTAKMDRPLSDADFAVTDEISFDMNGAGHNPSSKYMFRFKDYAPWVFRHLRDAFRLDPADYLMSLTAKYIVSELGSPGKSGSFFYYSRDYRFIIKTIRHAEHKLLRRILPQYYAHVKKYPDTLVSQFYGLHRVRLPFGRKIHFVVMNNVFPALYEIHERYDLKGSLLGREYNSNLTKPIVVYKDLDWLRRHRRVVLGPQKRERLVKQLEIDARFLERVNVMDYSLLVGIHDMSKGNSALNTLLRLKEFGPHGDQATMKERRQASEAVRGSNRVRIPNNAQNEFMELQALLQKANPEQLKEFDFADEYRSASYFYRDHGGFQSTNDANEEQDVIYYVGIIDFLTGYTFRKSVETFCKSLVHDRRELSAVPAQEYGERFLRFLRGSIGPEIKSTKPNKRNTDQSIAPSRSDTGDLAAAVMENGSSHTAAAPHATSDVHNQPNVQQRSSGQQLRSASAVKSMAYQRIRKQRTTVVSPPPSPRRTPEVRQQFDPAHRSSSGAAASVATEFHTPQKGDQNGLAVTPPRDSRSFDGTPSPGVAVTSNLSPTVTSQRPSPTNSAGRRPSIVGYGPNATSREG